MSNCSWPKKEEGEFHLDPGNTAPRLWPQL